MLTPDVWCYILESLSPIEAFFALIKMRTVNIAWLYDVASRYSQWLRLIQRLTPQWLAHYQPGAACSIKHLIRYGRFLVGAQQAIPPCSVVPDYQSTTRPGKKLGAFCLSGPFHGSEGTLYLIRIWMRSHIDNALYLNNRVFKLIFNQSTSVFHIHLLLPAHRLSTARFQTHGSIGVHRLHEPLTPHLWAGKMHFRLGHRYDNMETFMETIRSGEETFHYDWCTTRAGVTPQPTWQTKLMNPGA